MTAASARRSGVLPPGQVATRKLPVVGEKAPPAAALDLERWRLRVDGLVEAPFALTYHEVLALERRERRVDLHCVTGWTRFDTLFEGFPAALLLDRARPLPAARFVRFEAYSDRGHDTSLPLELVRRDTWLVDRVGGMPLAPEHGFPLRTLTPSRYFYKSLKWVHRLELLAADRLGYWERESSYHNRGDPWPGDERFATGSLRPGELERFREAPGFERWRRAGKVLLGLDLRGWRPASRDLRGLQLKRCDLRAARLAGADLSGGNFSLSDFRGAELRGASFRGADVEGANFAGADLRDADFRDTALSATRFVETRPDGTELGAQVAGMRCASDGGLVEDQEAYLRAAGVTWD